VLVVDDEDDVRQVAVAQLEALGYSVVEAATGHQALDLLKENGTIDLLLLDYAMPGMSGLAVARAAAASRPGIPIVFLTGYADPAVLDEAREIVVRKPYRKGDLASAVERALRPDRDAGSATVVAMKRRPSR
jgi:CheY-like chemotaxis protein